MDLRKKPSVKRNKLAPVSETETLNFKVTSEFKREFKGYAVRQGITMLDLLKEGFELCKRSRAS